MANNLGTLWQSNVNYIKWTVNHFEVYRKEEISNGSKSSKKQNKSLPQNLSRVSFTETCLTVFNKLLFTNGLILRGFSYPSHFLNSSRRRLRNMGLEFKINLTSVLINLFQWIILTSIYEFLVSPTDKEDSASVDNGFSISDVFREADATYKREVTKAGNWYFSIMCTSTCQTLW